MENAGVPCEGQCKNKENKVKQGPCDFCGAGVCCKKDLDNWNDPEKVGKKGFFNGCGGWNGGSVYQCTDRYNNGRYIWFIQLPMEHEFYWSLTPEYLY